MTALAFVHTETAILLLAGEGPLLRIYRADSCRLICTQKLSPSEHIHGIKARSLAGSSSDGRASISVLAWTEHSIFLLDLESHTDPGGQSCLTVTSVIEAHADDWILDACSCTAASHGHDSTSSLEAVLLSSHNVLFSLHATGANNNTPGRLGLRYATSGPRSLLCSAHVTWLRNARGLVAAGTVFGEVLVWSFPADALHSAVPYTIHSQLHYIFTGHEGSVFGVQISEHDSSPGSALARRFVASCSDDRTIRVWDVTDLSIHVCQPGSQGMSTSVDLDDDEHDVQCTATYCVATAMGHISRIWGLRFLSMQQASCHILSYGEDGTAQIWQLSTSTSMNRSSAAVPLHLQHTSTFALHSGKNIWSVAISQVADSGAQISTGGADGRITLYNVGNLAQSLIGGSWTRQYRMEEVCLHLVSRFKNRDSPVSVARSGASPESQPKRLFMALKGSWKLQRYLDSAIPTYLSGTLEGRATFEERAPTDPAYDMEYLYFESGQFFTQQGFSLSASRRYVYRYQERTGQISAWFVKAADGESADYLFHVLDFGDSAGNLFDSIVCCTLGHATASGHHLCVDDNYHASYTFSEDGLSIHGWCVKYTVKGPNKDYVADSRYHRDAVDQVRDASSGSEAMISTPEPSTTAIDTSLSEKSGPVKTDSFKTYTWIDENRFLVTTGDGWLLVGSITNMERSHGPSLVYWTQIGKYSNLKGTCLTASIEHTNMILLTGNDGKVYLYKHGSRALEPVQKLPRKVACLQTSSCRTGDGSKVETDNKGSVFVFASCLGSSTAYCLLLDVDAEGSKCRQSRVELPTAFITTSSHFYDQENILFLGSRSGDIAIYDTQPDHGGSLRFIQSLYMRHIHGGETVTTIRSLPPQTPKASHSNFYVLSAGRDGKYAIHRICMAKAKGPGFDTSFETVHMGTPSFGPNIEGAYWDQTCQDLLLWGFRSIDFVVWNDTRQMEIMTVECGGAHRNWAYTPLKNTNGGGRLLWTKVSALNLYSQSQASHQIMQQGGHGREIKAIALSPAIRAEDSSSRRYLATGAEDTTIRIFRNPDESQGANGGFRCLHTLSKHVTGIQQLRWSTNGRFLFSAAGREEFFVWRLQPVPCFDIGVVCLSQCPPVTESGDLRIMDFDALEVRGADISVTERYVLPLVYSDSSVRVSN